MGTTLLKNLHPNVEEIAMYSSNLANAKKQVVIVIDGTQYTLSPRLTEDFRTKKVGVDELGDYVVRVMDLKDEDDNVIGHMNSLGYAGEDTIVAVNWKKTDKVATKKVTLAELETMVAY